VSEVAPSKDLLIEKLLDSAHQAQIDCVSAKNQEHLHKYPNKAAKQSFKMLQS
jgi:hypothetical protein